MLENNTDHDLCHLLVSQSLNKLIPLNLYKTYGQQHFYQPQTSRIYLISSKVSPFFTKEYGLICLHSPNSLPSNHF